MPNAYTSNMSIKIEFHYKFINTDLNIYIYCYNMTYLKKIK